MLSDGYLPKFRRNMLALFSGSKLRYAGRHIFTATGVRALSLSFPNLVTGSLRYPDFQEPPRHVSCVLPVTSSKLKAYA